MPITFILSVAAIAGYHEYRSPIELFHQYIYQDLADLLSLDACNLDLVLVLKEDEATAVTTIAMFCVAISFLFVIRLCYEGDE